MSTKNEKPPVLILDEGDEPSATNRPGFLYGSMTDLRGFKIGPNGTAVTSARAEHDTTEDPLPRENRTAPVVPSDDATSATEREPRGGTPEVGSISRLPAAPLSADTVPDARRTKRTLAAIAGVAFGTFLVLALVRGLHGGAPTSAQVPAKVADAPLPVPTSPPPAEPVASSPSPQQIAATAQQPAPTAPSAAPTPPASRTVTALPSTATAAARERPAPAAPPAGDRSAEGADDGRAA